MESGGDGGGELDVGDLGAFCRNECRYFNHIAVRFAPAYAMVKSCWSVFGQPNLHVGVQIRWRKLVTDSFIVWFIVQESWNNMIFGKGGKQNPKTPKSSSNKDESANINDNDADSKAKTPSKHQRKSARKAQRVSDVRACCCQQNIKN